MAQPGRVGLPGCAASACGGYIKGGPWHSTCVESFFSHIPGWYVVLPSSADDAKGLIESAARAKDPVVFLEHKGLYRKVQARSMEPDANYIVPFGHGRIRREGTDATVVTGAAPSILHWMPRANRRVKVDPLRFWTCGQSCRWMRN